MRKKPNKYAFWLTNMTDHNISLGDLNLTIKAFASINLLDSRHYYYTLDQLIKSAISGSISKYIKIKRLAVRQVAPIIMKPDVPFLSETYLPTRERSTLVIKEEKYEELNVSDEQFAQENVEMVDVPQPLSKDVNNG